MSELTLKKASQAMSNIVQREGLLDPKNNQQAWGVSDETVALLRAVAREVHGASFHHMELFARNPIKRLYPSLADRYQYGLVYFVRVKRTLLTVQGLTSLTALKKKMCEHPMNVDYPVHTFDETTINTRVDEIEDRIPQSWWKEELTTTVANILRAKAFSSRYCAKPRRL